MVGKKPGRQGTLKQISEGDMKASLWLLGGGVLQTEERLVQRSLGYIHSSVLRNADESSGSEAERARAHGRQ